MPIEPLNNCLKLRTRWKAHLHGALAFSNSVGAHVGFSSFPLGRILERHAVLGSEAQAELDRFIIDAHGVRAAERPPDPSAAASIMLQTRTQRTSRRLTPMTIACLHAARAYAAERQLLLNEIMAVLINAKRKPSPLLVRELRAWQQLREALNELQAATTT